MLIQEFHADPNCQAEVKAIIKDNYAMVYIVIKIIGWHSANTFCYDEWASKSGEIAC